MAWERFTDHGWVKTALTITASAQALLAETVSSKQHPDRNGNVTSITRPIWCRLSFWMPLDPITTVPQIWSTRFHACQTVSFSTSSL